MTENEKIVKTLRMAADNCCGANSVCTKAADLIESLQGQLAEARTEIEQRNLAGDFTYVIGQFASSQGENGRLKGENRKLKKELAESQRREKAAGCETCINRETDSYRYYTYPCNECKHRARDSYEPMQSGPQENGK